MGLQPSTTYNIDSNSEIMKTGTKQYADEKR